MNHFSESVKNIYFLQYNNVLSVETPVLGVKNQEQ